MTNTQVLVLGNGPVGQTTALLLAKWGINVTILDERKQRDAVGSKAIAQHRDVLDVWEHVGAGNAIAREGLTWSRSRTYYGSTEIFCDTYFESADSPYPAFVNLSQTRTEELLDHKVAGNPFISVAWDQKVQDLRQDDSGVRVTASSADGKLRKFSADYVVAACGARSDGLRKALGVTLEGSTFDDRFLICDIKVDMEGWAGERRFYFDPEWNPGRQVLIHPCPGSQFRIDWQVPAGYDLEKDEADGGLDRRIRQIVGDAPYEIVWKSVYRFHSRVLDRMRVGKVLIAGDMAHLVSPFGGRGLNSGIGDAENAAWKLAYLLRGWAEEGILETYHAERRAAAVENIAVTTETMDFLVPQTESQRAHRVDLLERALRNPDECKNINSGRLFEPFWYADSTLTTPDSARPFQGRPLKGQMPEPGPGVITPDAVVTVDGSEYQLRRLLRSGTVLLLGSGVDAEEVRQSMASNQSSPVSVLELAKIDPSQDLQSRLKVRPREIWVVRPDAYISAVCCADDLAGLNVAVQRSHGGEGAQLAVPTSPLSHDVPAASR